MDGDIPETGLHGERGVPEYPRHLLDEQAGEHHKRQEVAAPVERTTPTDEDEQVADKQKANQRQRCPLHCQSNRGTQAQHQMQLVHVRLEEHIEQSAHRCVGNIGSLQSPRPKRIVGGVWAHAQVFQRLNGKAPSKHQLGGANRHQSGRFNPSLNEGLQKRGAQHAAASTGEVIITWVSTVSLRSSNTIRNSNWRCVKFTSRARSTCSVRRCIIW